MKKYSMHQGDRKADNRKTGELVDRIIGRQGKQEKKQEKRKTRRQTMLKYRKI